MDILLVLFIGIIVVFGILELVIWLRKKGKLGKREQIFVKTAWEEIRSTVTRDPKHAVIEADKLLDYVLKKRGYEGSLGEKLKASSSLWRHPNDVWNAHKLRNRSVHEVGFIITETEARKALSSYKQALWDIGVKIQ